MNVNGFKNSFCASTLNPARISAALFLALSLTCGAANDRAMADVLNKAEVIEVISSGPASNNKLGCGSTLQSDYLIDASGADEIVWEIDVPTANCAGLSSARIAASCSEACKGAPSRAGKKAITPCQAPPC